MTLLIDSCDPCHCCFGLKVWLRVVWLSGALQGRFVARFKPRCWPCQAIGLEVFLQVPDPIAHHRSPLSV